MSFIHEKNVIHHENLQIFLKIYNFSQQFRSHLTVFNHIPWVRQIFSFQIFTINIFLQRLLE